MRLPQNRNGDELNIYLHVRPTIQKSCICTYQIRVDRQVLVRVDEEKNVSDVGLEKREKR